MDDKTIRDRCAQIREILLEATKDVATAAPDDPTRVSAGAKAIVIVGNNNTVVLHLHLCETIDRGAKIEGDSSTCQSTAANSR